MIKLGRKKPKSIASVLRGVHLYLHLLASAGVVMWAWPGAARAELPKPCQGGCGPKANLGWISSGAATPSLSADGRTLSVHQKSDKAILNWQSFNIAKDFAVNFVQPNSESVALNRVFDFNKSVINGGLSANGQIYIINQNGILFGKDAHVNVHTLVASSLNIKPEDFLAGILSPIRDARSVFGLFTDDAGVAQTSKDITVEAGARLSTAVNGKIMLFAPNVTNGGSLSSTEGQIILAAGDKIYLQGSNDFGLRGLWVEVDSTDPQAKAQVLNLASGSIDTKLGNATLMGLMVNQQGRISATSSVSLNGSIRLLARSGAQSVSNASISNGSVMGKKTGTVTLAAGSRTEIALADDRATTAKNAVFDNDGNVQEPSRVEVMGDTIRMEGGSSIRAPGGEVTLTALKDPKERYDEKRNVLLEDARSSSRIELDAGSVIDVSGATASVAMERNQLAIDLRGSELADYREQRHGVLRGKKVYLDARRKTTLANVQPYVDNLPLDVNEMYAQGGTVSLKSEGDVNMQSGARVDVSGGQVNYRDGYLQTTQLISGGRVYDISNADPNRTYDGVVGYTERRHAKWGVTETWQSGLANRAQFQHGYTEGKNAGTLAVQGHGMTLDGTLRGETVRGEYQRAPADVPLGGQLLIGLAGELSDTQRTLRAPSVIFRDPARAAAAFTAGEGQTPLVLSTEFLDVGGFTRAAIHSDGVVYLPEEVTLDLEPGGALSLSGLDVNIQGQVVAPQGTVTVRSMQYGDTAMPHTVTLGEHARIDVRGQWVNDSALLPGTGFSPTFIDGGKVTLNSAGDLLLRAGSVIDVSGGGWLGADGKVKNGNAGDIKLAAHKLADPSKPFAPQAQIKLGGELRGAALGKGGTLGIEANSIMLAPATGAAPPENALVLAPEFFARGGFRRFDLTSNQGDLTVASGFELDLTAGNRVLDNGYRNQVSGANPATFTTLTTLPEAQRAPTEINLKVNPVAALTAADAGMLRVADGARLRTEIGGRITLSSATDLYVNGTLEAPAGTIQLTITPPPREQLDPGFRAEQSLWLGPQAQLLAQGAVHAQPNALGQLQGEVLPGGQVRLDAQRGYLVMQPGALIDVSGTAAELAPGTSGRGAATLPVASAAGTIALTAAEGMILDGSLRGVPGAEQVAGGRLELSLTRNNRGETWKDPSGPDRELLLTNVQEAASSTWQFGQALSREEYEGRAKLAGDSVRSGGFDALRLQSDAIVRVESGVDLNLERSITLDAPVIAVTGDGTVRIGASYVALENTHPNLQTIATSQAGTGELSLQAQFIDVTGAVRLNSAHSTLTSDGDIRLRGVRQGSALVGALKTSGDLVMHADQIYPATLTQFTVAVDAPQGTLMIQPGKGAAPVLSAGGALTLQANSINQGGVLKAPLGTITLDAQDQLTLVPGSITSVSAQGQVIPFGLTENAQSWVYSAGGSQIAITAPPQKNIVLQAPNIDVQQGATLDLSGGGEVQAYEFVPGPDGTQDVLANTSAKEQYAILPALGSAFAPYDPMLYEGSNLKPGDSIHIAGVDGLAERTYALLPARYALLPGAWLVQGVSGYQDLAAGQHYAQVNGIPVVSGYRTVAGTGLRDSRTRGFTVQPGSSVSRDAKYDLTTADVFFAQQAKDQDLALPRLAQDAGLLTLRAQTELKLDGTLNADAQPGGRGAAVDIVGDRLAVVNDVDAAGAVGELRISAANLNALGAESVLLGGTRAFTKDGTRVDVAADSVRVAEGAQLSAPDLMLAAKQRVSVEKDSSVAGVDGGAKNPETLLLNGDGALLRASGGAQVSIARSNSDGTQGGVIEVAQGAMVRATGSIALDASQDTLMNGTLEMNGGSLLVGASRIGLGAVPEDAPGFRFSESQLAKLPVDELVLTSRSALDIYGPVDIDTRTLRIDAPQITGHVGADETAYVNASERLTLTNSLKSSIAPVPVANGALELSAGEVVFGKGDYQIAGFERVRIAAQQQILLDGKGSAQVAGELTLAAPRIAGTAGADVSIAAQDAATVPKLYNVRIEGVPTLAKLPGVDLGAKLKVSGNNIDVTGRLELPAGRLTLDAQENIHLGSGAALLAGGAVRTFDDQPVYAPGGDVTLLAHTGSVTMDAEARIDVAGTTEGGDAGTLSVSAVQGTTRLDGGLNAHAAEGYRDGEFNFDVNNLADFAVLNRRLNDAGFSTARDLRVRSGDVELVAGEENTVRAQNFKLAVDKGAINVLGAIDASGADGGRVGLWARDDVTVRSGASIDAHGNAPDAKGGRVTLGTRSGSVGVAQGAVIDVSGGDGGTVNLRAPLSTQGLVALTELKGAIKGAKEIIAEPFIVANMSELDTAAIGSLKDLLSKEITPVLDAQAAALRTQLGAAGAALRVRPGVEVRSEGDLTVRDAWDLSNWRYGNEPGVLTLRAKGDLVFANSLSDGFDGASHTSRILDKNESWSYRLAAGADTSGADPLALRELNAADKGSVVINAGETSVVTDKKSGAVTGGIGKAPITARMVRTGTGDIDIAAARDVVLGNPQSMIYTAGVPLARRGGTPGNTAVYATDGGDIAIHARGSIRMQTPPDKSNPDQLITAWLHREGSPASSIPFSKPRPAVPGSWWVNYKYFQQGIGALGGGDITLKAGADIANVSAVIPTTKLSLSDEILGGGDLNVEAGADIRGGVFYVGHGEGDIRSRGSLDRGGTELETRPYPILALGDAAMRVTAGGDLRIESVLNPAVVRQSKQQADAGYSSDEYAEKNNSYFFTYSDASRIDMLSVAGDVILRNHLPLLTDASVMSPRRDDRSADEGMLVLPPTLRAAALQGDIDLSNGNRGDPVRLYPTPRGNLQLFAAGDIDIGRQRVALSDTDPAKLPTADRPATTFQSVNNALFPWPQNRGAELVHAGDPEPVRLVALRGSIRGEAGSELFLAKPAHIRAGQDITGVDITVQNLSPDDVTRVEAGRDVVLLAQDSGINVMGPGEVRVRAGRDVNLGTSKGIVASGDLLNSALPEQGADITVFAGVPEGQDFTAFVTGVLPRYTTGSAELAVLTASLRSGRQDPALTEQQVLTELLADPAAFGEELFFNELKLAGREKDFVRGEAAIATAFPHNNNAGDISLFYSQIRTLDGGDINLFAPHGGINGGLAIAPVGLNKEASELGIVAQSLGRVRAITRDDFTVNQSRVFTLRGGDITLWSSQGNIDAGKGSKSVVSAPKPSTSIDTNGNIKTELPASAKGSGIRLLVTDSADVPGAVDLIAPLGEVNAGDAGIDSSGKVYINADRVVGADNITAGGGITGVPVADTGSLAAGLTGVGNVAQSVGKEAADAVSDANPPAENSTTPLSDAALTFLEVEVLGYGECDKEGKPPDGQDCKTK